MTAPEILAPAGGLEQVIAAANSGADAVYLGGKRFNARLRASNFEASFLKDTVTYCHARGIKVYVTVNTLVTDAELPLLEEEADDVAASGADAVILQDMAALRLFSQKYPGMPRYASTQTAVHNVDGARFLQDLGYDSIVLARELTLSEMAKIAAAVPLKIEAFVHGAHCMSVSGMCYLSSMLGGRSGNRGLCAQPCRLDWTCGDSRYALSLKDMSLISHIGDMAAAGVDALKIEGRMKRPEYVAAAVTACRQARAGEAYDLRALEQVFSRSGFTDGYLTGRRDRTMFGYRTREDVSETRKVLSDQGRTIGMETPSVAVDMTLAVTETGSRLTVTDGTHTAAASGPAPERAVHRALDADLARRSLEKTGGTPYFLQRFTATLPDGVTLPVSALNALRRDALAALTGQRGAPCVYARGVYTPASRVRHVPAAHEVWARFSSPDQVTDTAALSRILLPAESITAEHIAAYGDRLTAELPAVLFPEDEERFGQTLAALADAGLSDAYTENIYGIALCQRLGLPVRGGMLLNVLNTDALTAYRAAGLVSMTLSFENAMGKARALGGSIARGVVSYGYLPLMQLRSCPVRAAVGCASCPKQIADRRGTPFPVVCSGKRYATLLNSVPLDAGDRDLSAFDYRLLYFTTETPARAEEVIQAQLAGQRPDAAHTTGLYYRTLL